jgi:DeoR family glycerol-3-phosphate regulon repressor
VANARRTILVCDQLKFARSAPVRICDVSEIHAFVSDAFPPRAFAEACARAGVQIAVADAGPAVSEAS